MGLLSNLFGGGEPKPPKKKRQKLKTVTYGDWEITMREDKTPVMFCKKGKDWLDSYEVWASPSGKYFIHEGQDAAADECIAITTLREGLKIKKTDESGIRAACITDEPVGYALSEEGTLYTLTIEKASQRKLGPDVNMPDAAILTPKIAAVAFDADDKVATIIRAIDISTGKAWKKVIKYEDAEEFGDGSIRMAEIKETAGGIEVTIPDGTVHSFTAAGTPLA